MMSHLQSDLFSEVDKVDPMVVRHLYFREYDSARQSLEVSPGHGQAPGEGGFELWLTSQADGLRPMKEERQISRGPIASSTHHRTRRLRSVLFPGQKSPSGAVSSAAPPLVRKAARPPPSVITTDEVVMPDVPKREPQQASAVAQEPEAATLTRLESRAALKGAAPAKKHVSHLKRPPSSTVVVTSEQDWESTKNDPEPSPPPPPAEASETTAVVPPPCESTQPPSRQATLSPEPAPSKEEPKEESSMEEPQQPAPRKALPPPVVSKKFPSVVRLPLDMLEMQSDEQRRRYIIEQMRDDGFERLVKAVNDIAEALADAFSNVECARPKPSAMPEEKPRLYSPQRGGDARRSPPRNNGSAPPSNYAQRQYSVGIKYRQQQARQASVR